MRFKILIQTLLLMVTGCSSMPDKLIPTEPSAHQLIDSSTIVTPALDCLSAEMRYRLGKGSPFLASIGDMRTEVDKEAVKISLPPSLAPYVRQSLSRNSEDVLSVSRESLSTEIYGNTQFNKTTISVQGGIVAAEIAGTESIEGEAVGISAGKVTEVIDLSLQLYLEAGRGTAYPGRQMGPSLLVPFRLVVREYGASVFLITSRTSFGLIRGNVRITQGVALDKALRVLVDAGMFTLTRVFAESVLKYKSACELDKSLRQLDDLRDRWSDQPVSPLELSLQPHQWKRAVCLSIDPGMQTPASIPGIPVIELIEERGPGTVLRRNPFRSEHSVETLSHSRKCWKLDVLDVRTDRFIVRLIGESGRVLGSAVYDLR